VVCDLSSSPYVDLAGASMLRELHAELANAGVGLRIVGARASVRDLLRAVGLDQAIGEIGRTVTLAGLLRAHQAERVNA
jgi:anti-anti-sigma regulatory factor